MRLPTPMPALSLALLMGAASGHAAPALPENILHCRADSSLDCHAATCERAADDGVQIDLQLSLAQNSGNLCTGTYCRAFEWLPVLGDSSPQRTFGPIRSEASGSTEPDLSTPVVDYHLWISADRQRFALVPLLADRGAWAGRCRHQD